MTQVFGHPFVVSAVLLLLFCCCSSFLSVLLEQGMSFGDMEWREDVVAGGLSSSHWLTSTPYDCLSLPLNLDSAFTRPFV